MAEAHSALCRDEAQASQGTEPLVSLCRVIVPPVSRALPEELTNFLTPDSFLFSSSEPT